MSTFTIDAQPTIQRATGRNPGLTDGTINLEFSFPPALAQIDYVENASFQVTLGGQERKQSDSLVRQVNLEWMEFSNFIPVKIFEMMRGQGNRARNNLTYVHHREILSQLPGTEVEFSAGIGQLNGFIKGFNPRRMGKDKSGTQIYRCRLVFQEANEVQP
ncbi:hypothetical protein LCGC14_1706280 [marine sediment metagenome]|uniref:Uncharacterized protein n=1 Tax=marine sediment metagenome TaxID=412755 RepID=A0A0F9HH03_9ZZZZ